MNEIHILLENILNKGFGLKVNKSDSHKAGLIINEIQNDTPASKANLKVGDHIIKVNDKNTKRGRNKLVTEINESKLDSLSLVIKRETKEPRHQSFMNLSSLSSLTNNSIQTFRNSKSSVDLNYSCPVPKQLLDSNFVTEDTINDFMQEDPLDSSAILSQNYRERTPSLFTLETSADDCRADSDSPQNSQRQSDNAPPSPTTSVQFTRKQAYRKVPDESESVVQSHVPKYNLKRATNTVSVATKDPVYVVKKKTNSFSVDGQFTSYKNVTLNSNTKNRYQPIPISRSGMLNVGSNSNSSINKSQTPSPICPQSTSIGLDFEDGNYFSSTSKTVIQPTFTPLNQAPIPNPENAPLPVEVILEMKILMFKEKISKPVWKKYLLEQEATGVIFECHDLSEVQTSLNSTALNPAIVSAELIMNVWTINNTPNRFYLPIGQFPYDSEMIRMATFEEIKITYPLLRLEFVINLLKVPPQHQGNVFKLLQVDPPEIKLPPAKSKKSISGIDHLRLETKKLKNTKAPENLLLSSLHKTGKVKGVPLIVIICVTIVEDIGLREEGIYRKNGNMAGKKLLEDIISTESPEKWASHDEWTNVHTTTSLLKSILRRYTLFDKDTAIKLSVIRLDVEEVGNGGDIERKVQAMMDMIYHLNTHFKPHCCSDENKCRIDTFKYIIKHLYRVSLCHEFTKMNADNLAMCFMPNLIEDIPSDDVTEYKTSKKSVIIENLNKMVAFWITYSDAVCEFLEEEREDVLNVKVLRFIHQKHTPDQAIMLMNNNVDKDVAILVKERIEYFTESVTTLDCNSPNNIHSNINTPDSYFSRTKNSRLYQSVKQPKKINIRRRNSSGSPIDPTKTFDTNKVFDSVNLKSYAKIVVGSPPIPKKSDTWSSKTVRKKKESSPGDMPGMELISLLISGCKKDVPLVVVACVKIIEKFGIEIDGIYRISGRNQDIGILDALVMSNDTDKWLLEPNIKLWSNMHNTACLMKKILKKFCLIPKEMWTHMSAQISEKFEPEDVKKVLKAAAYHLRVEQSKANVNVLSGKIEFEESKNDAKHCESRFRSGTLRYVLQHLKQVANHELVNRMNSNSLAICFVPVLMEEDYNRTDMLTVNTKCIQIVQLLIDHCDWIFQWDGSPSEDLFGQTMSDSLERYLATYSPTLCRETDLDTTTLVADYDEVRCLLKGLIESSFHFSDVAPNSLRIYFDNSTLSSTLPTRSAEDS